MADPVDPNLPPPDGDVPYESEAAEPLEIESPRRSASAEFVVDAQVGSQAVLREAMDPANQSLAEALRLSFRVLQVVILVLVVLFLASGFQTVEENQSGVLTVWGRIVPVDDQESLEPGLQWSWWPYPIGEFLLFDVENRAVDLGDTFWPRLAPELSMTEAVEMATVNQPLRAGRDGALLTSDGGLAHVRVKAKYVIAEPSLFVHRVRDTDTDALVRLALARATFQFGTGVSLQGLVEGSEDISGEVRRLTQQVLDEMRSGIEITEIGLPEAPIPPLAIQKAFGELQNAKVSSENAVERARARANRTLTGAAGEGYREILELIDKYEDATDAGDDATGEDLLAQINEWMESDEASGGVSDIVKQARSYVSEVEATLGNEARRFAGLLPTFREHPELVVSERWFTAYATVLGRQDTEQFYVPDQLGEMKLILTGLDSVANLRRKLLLERREAAARQATAGGMQPYILRAGDIRKGAGRRLNVEEGQIRAPGGNR